MQMVRSSGSRAGKRVIDDRLMPVGRVRGVAVSSRPGVLVELTADARERIGDGRSDVLVPEHFIAIVRAGELVLDCSLDVLRRLEPPDAPVPA